MKLAKVIAEKNRQCVNSICPETSLRDAATLMCERGVGALLVMETTDGGEKVAGIISERDILRRSTTDDDFRSAKVEDAMTRDVIIAKIDDDVNYVMSVMDRKHIRHLPVYDGGELKGLLSIRDIIRSLLEEKNIQVTHLSDYVCGTRASEVF